MFYEYHSLNMGASSQKKIESAVVVLNPSESKRLIAKAVATISEVKAVLGKGPIVISPGTTCA